MQQRKRLSKEQLRNILKCFSSDIEASEAAKITVLNRNTINKYYKLFREIIFTHYERPFYLKDTVCEIDESYFGPRRFRAKNGEQGGRRKIIVFGIIERNGRVFTEIVPNIKTRTLFEIIKQHVDTSTTIYSDECNSYNYLKVKKYKHETVTHSRKEFARGEVSTNSIECFWSYCKRRLNKFNGVDKNNFAYHLRECEFRFNNRNFDLELILEKLISKNQYLNFLLYN